MTTVFLDANVLVPITLTNVLLTAAEDGLFQVRWSPDVVEEAVNAIIRIRPNLPMESIERRFSRMAEAFEDALVSGDIQFEETLVLPDPNDRHVVAAAMTAEASVILTENSKDFPKSELEPLDLVALTPDQFLTNLLEENEQAITDVIERVADTLVRPPRSVEDILTALEGAHITQFTRTFRSLNRRNPS